MIRIIGIDPGVSGAIALLERKDRRSPSTFLDVADMPTFIRNKTARIQRPEVNPAELCKIIEVMKPDEIFIELVSAMPPRAKKAPRRTPAAEASRTTKQKVRAGESECPTCGLRGGGMGAASAFDFGEAFGIAKATCAVLGLRYELITPAQWKTLAGLKGATKAASRTLAQRLFPGAPLANAGHDGRAEALLIADTCSRGKWG